MNPTVINLRHGHVQKYEWLRQRLVGFLTDTRRNAYASEPLAWPIVHCRVPSSSASTSIVNPGGIFG
jgi:hypothetical protein